MCPTPKVTTVAERYDRSLRYAHGNCPPVTAPQPLPTSAWPKENIQFLEKYYAWLIEGGTAQYATNIIYLPMAGHILGMNLVPHQQINLESDLDQVLDYIRAKGVGADWLSACRHGLEKFRRFLRLERGLGEPGKLKVPDLSRYMEGLPAWLVSELERYQRIQQKSWRPARIDANLYNFWSKHAGIWRFFCREREVRQLADLKRQHILDYVDRSLAAGLATSTVNNQIRILHSFLLFLQDEGYAIPQSLLRIQTLKEADALPKYLTDEQVIRLRDEIERGVREAQLPAHRREALLLRAAFFLLWQGGMRLGEVEELCLEDLDILTSPNMGHPGGRLTVRNGKGQKDRTIYLTPNAVLALQSYLAVRGPGTGSQVFLYRNAPMHKDFLHAHLAALGEGLGVKVHAHRLRHTCATQLLNAGCRITSIQRFLGHKKLNTTMIYARAHDQNVADDYFAAMQRIEQRLDVAPAAPLEPAKKDEVIKVQDRDQLVAWVEILSQPELSQAERLSIAWQLKQALAGNHNTGLPSLTTFSVPIEREEHVLECVSP